MLEVINSILEINNFASLITYCLFKLLDNFLEFDLVLVSVLDGAFELRNFLV